MTKKPESKQTLEEKIDLLTRLFIESVRDTCEEPEVVSLIHQHVQNRMGQDVHLKQEEDGLWYTHFGENGCCIATNPVIALRGAYREWRKMADTKYPPIEVIPADPPKDTKLNWTCREYIGSVIYRLPKDETTWPQDPHAWAAYLADPVNRWSLDDPPPVAGDKIVVQGLFGPFVAIVKAGEHDLYAESKNENFIIPLYHSTSQPSDDRNAWVSGGIINKRAIEKLELYSDADEKHDPKPPKE